MSFISSIWSCPYQEHVNDETRSLICYVASGYVTRWCVHQTSLFIMHFFESPTYNGLWFKTCCVLDIQEHRHIGLLLGVVKFSTSLWRNTISNCGNSNIYKSYQKSERNSWEWGLRGFEYKLNALLK